MLDRLCHVRSLERHPARLLECSGDEATLHPNGLATLNALQGTVYVVVVMGQFRSGKSYIASRLLGFEGVAVPASLEQVTDGIDIVTWPISSLIGSVGERCSEGDMDMHIVVLDCEGFDRQSLAISTLMKFISVSLSTVVLFASAFSPTAQSMAYLGQIAGASSLVSFGAGLERSHQDLVHVVNRASDRSECFGGADPAKRCAALAADLITASFKQRVTFCLPFKEKPSFEASVDQLRKSVIARRRPMRVGGAAASGWQLVKILDFLCTHRPSLGFQITIAFDAEASCTFSSSPPRIKKTSSRKPNKRRAQMKTARCNAFEKMQKANAVVP